jgi:BlaI family transcriptional regulator, penicillinase repressor
MHGFAQVVSPKLKTAGDAALPLLPNRFSRKIERMTTIVVFLTTAVIMPKRIPKISDTEWEIMRIAWSHHPITAAEIIRHLTADDPTWHPKTVRTLLARLVEKGALTYEERSSVYFYQPRVGQEECVASASGSFVERVFGGSLKPMLAHFIEQRRLSREELDELRALLDERTDASPKKRGRNDDR